MNEIQNPKTKIESHCHIKDTFNRKIAHARAFGSVFNQMFTDAGLSDNKGKGPGKAVLAQA
jgi:hypothetical protein